jgi:hypothetical protein
MVDRLGPLLSFDGEILNGDSGEPCTEETCGEQGGARRAAESESESEE